jgi:molybdate transport system permease protein
MANFDLSPLWISLRSAGIATLISFFFGVLAAGFIMYRKSEQVIALFDGIFTLPMVLPPTVTGFLLLILFSPVRPFGSFLKNVLGITIVQKPVAVVIASAVVSFPLMYKSARSAFEEIDIGYIEGGRALGLKERHVFVYVALPLAAPGITGGVVLTFLRALGEYGATYMLAGNIKGRTRTISTAIASEVASFRYGTAAVYAAIVILISLLAVLAVNFMAHKHTKTVKRWHKSR